jgi:capsular exopolysaccharide synthesis family protein
LEQPVTAPPSDLREYLHVLRRRKGAILIITAITFASAMAFSIRQTPIYASTAKILVKPPTANQYLQNVPAASLLSLDTERELVQSDAVASIAADAMGSTEPSDLVERVSVSVPTNTQILEITFSDPDPALAQTGARSFADAYLEFKTSQALDAFASVRTGIQRQIDDLQRDLTEARASLAAAAANSPEAQRAQSDIDTITSQVAIYRNQMGTLSVVDVDPGDVVQPATVPTSPVSPNFPRNGALAMVVGLALGVGLAFLRERLDDRLHGREDLEEAIGAPTLAIIPTVPGWRKRDLAELQALSAPKGTAAEAYRTLRTNLLFMAKDGDIKTVVITSPTAGEGKTTTAANLAVSLAQADKRVIVVSADLRKPRLHRFYHLNNEIGVASVLLGRATLNDAVQRPLGVTLLRVIASGPVPTSPSELLASERMDAFLDQLRKSADFVILDTAPVLAVADALILAPKADAVVIVADAAMTTRGAVQHLREQLAQVGGNVVGGVFNNFDPARAKYYSPYYRTYYTHRYQAEDRAERPVVVDGAATPAQTEDLWRTKDIWS